MMGIRTALLYRVIYQDFTLLPFWMKYRRRKPFLRTNWALTKSCAISVSARRYTDQSSSMQASQQLVIEQRCDLRANLDRDPSDQPVRFRCGLLLPCLFLLRLFRSLLIRQYLWTGAVSWCRKGNFYAAKSSILQTQCSREKTKAKNSERERRFIRKDWQEELYNNFQTQKVSK